MRRSPYEEQVLRQRSRSHSTGVSPSQLYFTPQNIAQFALWQVGGLVAIVACSEAPTFTLEKLQFVFGVFALVVGGAEAIQRQEWVLFALGVLGAGVAWFRPVVALLVWGYGAVGYGRSPSILSVSLAWYALVVLVRAFVLRGEG